MKNQLLTNNKKRQLDKIVVESVNQFLMEELGISQEVFDAAQIVYQAIINNNSTLNSEEVERGISLFVDTIVISIFNTEVIISYKFYSPSNYQAFDSFMRKHYHELQCTSQGKKIALNIVDDSYDTRFGKASIVHELLHLYQAIQGNDNLLGQARELYSIAAQHLTDANTLVAALSKVIYLSINSEQSAYCQELYQTCMAHDDVDFMFKQTTAYQLHKESYFTLKQLEKLDSLPQAVIELYPNKTLPWFIKLTTKVHETFKKRIYKAYLKAKEDKAKENYWKNPPKKSF